MTKLSDEEIRRFNENFKLFQEIMLRNTEEVVELRHEEKKNRETNEKNIQFMQNLVREMMDDAKNAKKMASDAKKTTQKKRYATLWKVLDWTYKIGITLLCLSMGVKMTFFN